MTNKLIHGWKIELFEGLKPQSSILIACKEHLPFFSGYSKDPVNLSKLQDERFITIYRELGGLATSSFRVDRIHRLECTPVYKPDNTFEEAAKPLIKWLAENIHPHHTVIVTSTNADLLEGSMSFPTDEFLKD